MIRFIAGLSLLCAMPLLYDEGMIAVVVGIVGMILFAYGLVNVANREMENGD
jgi:hypothetical protein